MCDISGYSESGEFYLSQQKPPELPELPELIDDWKIFYRCIKKKLLIYISKEEYINEKFHDNEMLNPEIILGFIEADLDNHNQFNIRMLRANKKRQGIATYLFIILAYICIKNSIPAIILENGSGIDDFYSNLGCTYDEYPFPEMTCLRETFPEQIKEFIEWYPYIPYDKDAEKVAVAAKAKGMTVLEYLEYKKVLLAKRPRRARARARAAAWAAGFNHDKKAYVKYKMERAARAAITKNR